MAKNILLIDIDNKNCNYYNDTVQYLKKYNSIKICSPYNFKTSNENNNFNADLILINYSITNGVNFTKTKINNDLNLPIYIILNKEYDRLDEKLKWITEIKPKKCFSVHHDIKIFEKNKYTFY